jgi:hypothetical protein
MDEGFASSSETAAAREHTQHSPVNKTRRTILGIFALNPCADNGKTSPLAAFDCQYPNAITNYRYNPRSVLMKIPQRFPHRVRAKIVGIWGQSPPEVTDR